MEPEHCNTVSARSACCWETPHVARSLRCVGHVWGRQPVSSQCRASLDTPRGGAEQASVVQAPLPSFHHVSILPWPTARETASWTRVSTLQTPPLLSLALSFLISEVNNDPTIGGGRAHTGLGDKVQALAVTAVPARGQCTGLSEPLRTCCTCHGLAGHSGSAPGTN